tara:strand:+ start:1488 stop:1721 length:234 start_codon:yes stop_codon:yes gene_type:complete
MQNKKVNITLDQTPNIKLNTNEMLFNQTFVITTDEQKTALNKKEWSSFEAMIKSIALNKAFKNGLKLRGQTVIFKIL